MDSTAVSNRGQGEVLGVVLVFGLIIAGAVLVVGLGATAIGDTEDGLSNDRAEKSLTQFDSKAGLVALGDAGSQDVDFPTGAGERYQVDEDAGQMKITVENLTSNEEWEDPVLNETLGVVTYEGEDSQMAYQGGGVWRVTENGGSMVSPPEFHYREGTLTLPAVTVRGEGSLHSGVTIAQGDEDTKFPQADSENKTNPLSNHLVTLEVQSEYYRGWGDYFEERTDGEVEYEHENNTVLLDLKTPIGEEVVEGALSATSSAGEMKIAGNQARTDSYNSSDGPYSSSQSSNGNISVAGDFDIGGGSTVEGSVRTGADFECRGNSEVTGDVFYTDDFDAGGGCNIGGDDTGIDGVGGAEPLNDHVEDTVTDLESPDENDNNEAAVIDGEELDFSSGDTLTAGGYYLENMVVDSSETLTLDTQGDRLTIAVRDYVELEENAEIDIEGDGQVQIHILGDDTIQGSNLHAMLDDNSRIETEGPIENSTNFWIYGQDDLQAQIGTPGGDEAYMEGVIYAPASDTGSVSRVDVEHGEVFGGLVLGEVELHNGQDTFVHFDEALEQEQVVPEDTSVVRITYLHVTTNEIQIDG